MMHVALLRAINVGGTKLVKMEALRDCCAGLGFTNVRTLLQSGNLIFSSAPADAELERLLETRARKELDLNTEFFVRSAKEWARIINGNPFPEDARRDPARLILMLLKEAPKAKSVEALRVAITGPETVHVQGRDAYFIYPDGTGRSRLTLSLIEKKLGTRATGRNWNTVLKIAALTESGT